MKLILTAALVPSLFLFSGIAGCAADKPAKSTAVAPRPDPIPPPAVTAAAIAEYPGLHNVVAYSDGLYSGSVPYGDAGFDSLAAMGIRTIISVDGASPDVSYADVRGMRYVHLPITYSGMSDERRMEVARAIRDLPHPIYIHCHHGKHRSAAATGAALVTLGIMTPEEAEARMKVSGTAPNYTGLWQCVAVATIASTAQIDAADATFPRTFKTTGLVQSMVSIDEANDHLKLIEAAGWKAPADHPDLVPAATAGEMADLFRVLHNDKTANSKPADLVQWLDAASAEATALEEGIVRGETAEALSAKFKIIANSCKDCHVKYRD